MSSPTENRPVTILYPSPQERVNSYMAAIRLASSLRDSMDAQKAGVDTEKTAPLADSHHPNVPPQPSAKSATSGVREPNLILNQTASTHFTYNTTKAGFVHSQDGPSNSTSTGIWPPVKRHPPATAIDPFALATTPTDATLEALKRHQGYFPPPIPPPTTGEDIKREVPKQHKGYFPPPDPPMPTTNPTHNLATGHLHTDNIFTSHILSPRNTAVCEAPISFDHRLACAGPKLAFSLVAIIFLLFSLVLCLTRRKRLMAGQREYTSRQQIDVEIGNATWPRPAQNFELQPKPPRAGNIAITNRSETKLKQEIRASLRGYRRLDGGVKVEQYEPVAWRSRAFRAERAGGGGRVGSDAGPVGLLPGLDKE